MSAIRTSIVINDGMSPALRGMNKALNIVLSSFQAVQEASGQAVDTASIQAAREELAASSVALDKIEDELRQAGAAQEDYTEKIRESQGAAGSLLKKVKSLVGAYATIQTAKKAIDITDAWSQTGARMKLVAREGETVEGIQQKIFASANRARAVYMDTADIVAKIGLRAGSAFGSTDEIIAFSETLNKMYTIAGASREEQASSMLQLTQALGSGVLRGEEFNAVFEAAPNIMQAVADSMGVPLGALRDLAADGEITAEIVKNAILGATEEVNQDFESMPATFGQAFNLFSNQALMALQPVWQRLGQISSSEEFLTFANGAGQALATVANLAVTVLDVLSGVAGFVADNWSVLVPIIMGVAAAVAWYTVITKGAAAAMAFWNGVQKAGAFVMKGIQAIQNFVSIGWGVLTGNTAAASASQFVYNSALMACPLTWILIAITAVIAALYIGVAAWNKWTGSSVSATGIIMGALNVLKTVFLNLFALWWNKTAAFVNFFANVWNDPVAAVKILFLDLANSVIGYVLKMAEAIESIINKIPGVHVDITSGLGNFQKKIQDASAEIKSESGWKEVAKTIDYGSYTDAFSGGYDRGKGLEDKISSKISDFFSGNKNEGFDTALDYQNILDSINAGVGETASNTGKQLDISDENLVYIRDLAEQEAINRFTTAEIKVDMVNNNNVSSSMDLDGIMNYLAVGVNAAIGNAAEGVHE